MLSEAVSILNTKHDPFIEKAIYIDNQLKLRWPNVGYTGVRGMFMVAKIVKTCIQWLIRKIPKGGGRQMWCATCDVFRMGIIFSRRGMYEPMHVLYTPLSENTQTDGQTLLLIQLWIVPVFLFDSLLFHSFAVHPYEKNRDYSPVIMWVVRQTRCNI